MRGKDMDDIMEEETRREAARIFTRVREIPYVLGLHTKPSNLFSDNKGHCSTKHLFLLPKLKQLGYQVELGIVTFNWQDISAIPTEISALLKDPIDTHLFLYARRNDTEMIIDASWDSGMPAGFSVNSWDGDSQTVIGVPAMSIQRMSYPVLSARVALGNLIDKIYANESKPTPFNDAFNAWLGRTNA